MVGILDGKALILSNMPRNSNFSRIARIVNWLIRGGFIIKASFVLSLFFGYLYYQYKRQKVRRVFKKNSLNAQIIEHLKPMLDNFKPTFYLPNAFFQILRGQIKAHPLVKYEKQLLDLPDGGKMTLEWFPENFASMSSDTPVVAFMLGACGSSNDYYCKELAQMVAKKGWRIVVINRRGFGYHQIASQHFCSGEEFSDFAVSLEKIKEIFQEAEIYLIGVSAGANLSAKYSGLYSNSTPIKALVSISNPYNIGRISFTMKHNRVANFFSRVLATEFKKLVNFHSENPLFQGLVKEKYGELNFLKEKLQNTHTCWKLDKLLTSKLGGYLIRSSKRLRLL